MVVEREGEGAKKACRGILRRREEGGGGGRENGWNENDFDLEIC